MAIMQNAVGDAVYLAARVAQAGSPSTTSEAGGAETSPANEDRDRNNNSSSPLLFFVALGFGVVFTNLW